jgi:hypothetical protein
MAFCVQGQCGYVTVRDATPQGRLWPTVLEITGAPFLQFMVPLSVITRRGRIYAETDDVCR